MPASRSSRSSAHRSWCGPPSRSAAAAVAGGVRRIAVIDLGSNSFRLVVFTYVREAWWKRTDEIFESVRIGEGLEATGGGAAGTVDGTVEVRCG